MTLQDLRTLLDFHYWARDRILAAVRGLTAEQFTRDMGSSFPSVRDTLVHLYGGGGMVRALAREPPGASTA